MSINMDSLATPPEFSKQDLSDLQTHLERSGYCIAGRFEQTYRPIIRIIQYHLAYGVESVMKEFKEKDKETYKILITPLNELPLLINSGIKNPVFNWRLENGK